jgi:hypothetical protein
MPARWRPLEDHRRHRWFAQVIVKIVTHMDLPARVPLRALAWPFALFQAA